MARRRDCWSDYVCEPDGTLNVACLENAEYIASAMTQEEIDAKEKALLTDLESFLPSHDETKKPWIWHNNMIGPMLVIPGEYREHVYRALAIAAQHYRIVTAQTVCCLTVSADEVTMHRVAECGAEGLERILLQQFATHRLHQKQIMQGQADRGQPRKLIPFCYEQTLLEDPRAWHLSVLGKEIAVHIYLERRDCKRLARKIKRRKRSAFTLK